MSQDRQLAHQPPESITKPAPSAAGSEGARGVYAAHQSSARISNASTPALREQRGERPLAPPFEHLGDASLQISIIGLSISSSWGNGHATTYRALARGLARAGHAVTFFECDTPWYAANRDCPHPEGATLILYENSDELLTRHQGRLRHADVVIVGSYVRDGVAIGRWVTQNVPGLTAFYDIDTPVTLAKLARGDHEYLEPALVPQYELYLSFTGGPILEQLEDHYGAPMARALYCSVDTDRYTPLSVRERWQLGYLGTYSPDRQPTLERLLFEAARQCPDDRFVVAGASYPPQTEWPDNVQHHTHIPPAQHPSFYASQAFTLNVTRQEMRQAGWSPSVRLFEAAACATPIISDWWEGLDGLLAPGRDVLIATDTKDVLRYFSETSPTQRRALGQNARARVLRQHSHVARARELLQYVGEASRRRPAASPSRISSRGHH